MKILRLDKNHGILEIRVESHEDFFILNRFLEEGDLITSETSRKIKHDNEVYRKSMTVTLSFKKASYQSFGKRLRISGIVKEGPEDFISRGSYHTINLEINDSLIIERSDLNEEDLIPLQKAERYTKRPPILLVAIERGIVSIGILSSYELKIIKTIKRDVSNKGMDTAKGLLFDFFSEVRNIISNYLETIEAIIIAGPGFTKKRFKKYLVKDIQKVKIFTGKTSSGTVSGLHEIIRRGIPEEVRANQRISKETRMIEELLTHIGKNDGLATYGYKKVKKAVEYGAVDTLLVSSSKFYSKETKKKVLELIKETREQGGIFQIISVKHPSGKQFDQMTGIGALLRYKFKD